MNKEKKETSKAKCKYCDYEWNTRSKLKYISCPSCLNKIKNPNKKEKDPE